MIAMTSRSMTAAGAALLLMVALAACGGSSKTSSNTTNASSSRLPRSAAEVPLASAKDLRAKPALGKFLACMRAHGVHNFPGPAALCQADQGPRHEELRFREDKCPLLRLSAPNTARSKTDSARRLDHRSRPLQGALRVHGTDPPRRRSCVPRTPLRYTESRRHRDLQPSRSSPAGGLRPGPSSRQSALSVCCGGT